MSCRQVNDNVASVMRHAYFFYDSLHTDIIEMSLPRDVISKPLECCFVWWAGWKCLVEHVADGDRQCGENQVKTNCQQRNGGHRCADHDLWLDSKNSIIDSSSFTIFLKVSKPSSASAVIPSDSVSTQTEFLSLATSDASRLANDA